MNNYEVNMILKHIALVSSSQEKADKFYSDLLGLNKSEPKVLSASLSNAIFQINEDLTIINYSNDSLIVEIFILHDYQNKVTSIAHTCIEVSDFDDFINKCKEFNININQVPKNDKVITFVSDFDNNLFEIK